MTQVIKQKEIENQQDKIIEIQKTNLKELKQIPFVDAAKLIYKKKLGEVFQLNLHYSLIEGNGNQNLKGIFARRVIRDNKIFIEIEFRYHNGKKPVRNLIPIHEFINTVNTGFWVILA